MKQTLLFAAAIFVFAATPTANADIYKWIDDHGTVKYGEKPPSDRKYTKVKAGKFKSPADAKKTADQNKSIKTPATAKNPAISSKELNKLKQQQVAACNKMTAQLKTLKESARVRVTGPSKETRYMTYEERLKAIADTEKGLKGCK